MDLANFLLVNTYLGKVKVTLILIGGYVQVYMWPLKSLGFYNLLYLNEWMNWADILNALKVSGKLKVTMGMHMVEYGCDFLGPGTLKSALSQE